MSPWKPSLFNVGQISVFKIKRLGLCFITCFKVEKYVIVVKK